MRNVVDSSKLAQIINDVWDGVEKSKLGELETLRSRGFESSAKRLNHY